jgi:hypothetical protein
VGGRPALHPHLAPVVLNEDVVGDGEPPLGRGHLQRRVRGPRHPSARSLPVHLVAYLSCFASGVHLRPPRCPFALVVPTPAGVNQRKREPTEATGHMPESRRKKSARVDGFRNFETREVAAYGNLGPRPRSATLETPFWRLRYVPAPGPQPALNCRPGGACPWPRSPLPRHPRATRGRSRARWRAPRRPTCSEGP